MSVKQNIIQRIDLEGAISFHDFMEMALYYPKLGYYMYGGEKIGKHGDYYTSPYLGSFFGELIGTQLEEMWTKLGNQAFSIVEYGAGNALLCIDILKHLQHNSQMYKLLTYYIVEKSPAMSERAKKSLNGFEEKVKWIHTIGEINNFIGCVLSNELLDNFAIHQVVMLDELMEIFVEYKEEFSELHRPAAEELKAYLQLVKLKLPKGYRTEINLEIENWIKEIASSLHRGFIITIDYGYLSEELFELDRSSGTLLCYHQHVVSVNPYQHVGEQDITAQVNFSALSAYGARYGLQTCGYTSQSNFLLALGLSNHLKKMEEKKLIAHTHTSNEMQAMLFSFLLQMGRKIKVMIQQKGTDCSMLSGMKFSLKPA